MTTELTVLTLAALLQVVQFTAYSIAGNRQVGTDVAMGPRDTPVHLTGVAGRLQRALNNHFEALTLFTIAVVVVTLADQSTTLTRACAWVYLAARIAYVPAYVSGVPGLRSAIWFVGLSATVLTIPPFVQALSV